MYILLTQESLNDEVEEVLCFKDLKAAKKYAAENDEDGNGYIYTILLQNKGGFVSQVAQATRSALSWIE